MKSKAGRIGWPFATVVPVFAIALALQPRVASPVTLPAAGARCTATLDPDTVGVQAEPVSVSYAVPDSIGPIASVTAPEDSGIRVGTVNPDSRKIQLNTGSAAEGDWTLNLLDGKQKSCAGTLTIRQADGGR
jgi:hypothetical protein